MSTQTLTYKFCGPSSANWQIVPALNEPSHHQHHQFKGGHQAIKKPSPSMLPGSRPQLTASRHTHRMARTNVRRSARVGNDAWVLGAEPIVRFGDFSISKFLLGDRRPGRGRFWVTCVMVSKSLSSVWFRGLSRNFYEYYKFVPYFCSRDK